MKIGAAAIPAHPRIPRRERHGAVEHSERLDMPVGQGQRQAEIVMRARIGRRQRNRAAVAGDRRFDVLQVLERIAEIGPHRRLVIGDRQRPAEAVDGLVRPLHHAQVDAARAPS